MSPLSLAKRALARHSLTESRRLPGYRRHVFVAVIVAAVLASSLASHFIRSPTLSGMAAFCAVWIGIYPLTRTRRHADVPAWAHWAHGAIILALFWLLMRVAAR